jgi:hypothetical protein
VTLAAKLHASGAARRDDPLDPRLLHAKSPAGGRVRRTATKVAVD